MSQLSEKEGTPVDSYDVIIAGGGASGMLTASRIAESFPNKTILVVEKEESLGGRLKANKADAIRHSYGLNAISPKLFSYWNQGLGADAEASDLEDLVGDRRQRFGAIAGGKVSEADCSEWLTGKGSRILGGYAAKRQWDKVSEIIESGEEEDHASTAFSQSWKLQRKAPASVVLEHYAGVFGIADLWSASPDAIAARGSLQQSELHYGNFEQPLEMLVEPYSERVTVLTDCWIVKANQKEDVWSIDTSLGPIEGKHLVVAQPPWQAVLWLDRSYWPSSILSILSKTKPVSAVVLSATIKEGSLEIPEVTMVPSEKVQIIRTAENQITFQATVDFEVSLQAPDVVKAVKRLKRASRKLVKTIEGLELSDEYVALMPYAWPRSPMGKDRRFFNKLSSKPFNTASLMFVGDTYGAEFDGDDNIISSIGLACEALASVGGSLAPSAKAEASPKESFDTEDSNVDTSDEALTELEAPDVAIMEHSKDSSFEQESV